MDNDQIIWLVQENKQFMEWKHPSTQLVLEAVAAFDANNRRQEELQLPPQQHAIMPGIMLIGTYPIFYKIPVSITLLTAIQECQYPEQETVVNYYAPVLPEHLDGEGYYQGMKPVGNRNVLLSCYEAFKQFLE
jgi:hypothetical protein